MAAPEDPLQAAETSQAAFNHHHLPPTTFPSKLAQSAPDSSRRHSLPLHFLPPTLWAANTSTASLVKSEDAARGEHIVDEATVANRISALRQLNGASRSRHRYAKSTGARNSTFSQPVIVRTYSGASRPRPQRRDLVVKKENGYAAVMADKMDVKLPPVEAFGFKGIMDEIRHGVSEDLERIAEICARSKYSLSNQYEVHMPPHGRGDPVLVGIASVNAAGPTLEAIGSDEEQTRNLGRGSRAGRRTKAYGTLETIMSSSRSSDEDKSRKKSAAVLAEEVRGRAAKKQLEISVSQEDPKEVSEATPATERPRNLRSRSATFASMVIDNAQGSKHNTIGDLTSQTLLISEPARPQTSTTAPQTITSFEDLVPAMPEFRDSALFRSTITQSASRPSTVQPSSGSRLSLLESLNTWLPWTKKSAPTGTFQQRARSGSNAEGSLRDLLKSTDADKKGKRVDRSG